MSSGFTLIETLVALALIALVSAVALESQVVTLKMEQAARDTQALRLAAAMTLAAGRLHPENPFPAGTQSADNAILAEACAVKITNCPGNGQWMQWNLRSRRRPELNARIFTWLDVR